MQSSSSDNQVVLFSVGTMCIDRDGFCRITFHKGAKGQLGIPEVKEIGEIAFTLCAGKKRRHVIDCRGVYGPVLPGAREEIRNNEKLNACRTAAVMLVDNMANKLLANFFIQFNKPPYPYRVYEDEEAAIKWLKSL